MKPLALALAALLLVAACATPTVPPAAPSSDDRPAVTTPRRERLPNGDRDRDGVANGVDECPDISEDGDSVMDQDGCPEEDADQDGTLDVTDACPTEPGSARPEPNKNGCPYIHRILPAEIRILVAIQFGYADAATLTTDGKDSLDTLAAALKDHPEILKIEIRGYASVDEPKADELGEKRARKVSDELVSRGVEASRLVTSTRGSSAPIGDEKTTDGRTQNRRVDFVILDKR